MQVGTHDETFGPEDLRQLAEAGIALAEARRQIELFRHPPAYIRLERPCRIGDGIRPLDASAGSRLPRYESARAASRLLRFVPASGAASRMFQALLEIRSECPDPTRVKLRDLAAGGNQNAGEVLAMLESIERFAFADDLRTVTGAADLSRLEAGEILDALLSVRGLDYATQPKGLLKFHRDDADARTALEEHLAEAAAYLADRNRVARLHFTVSPEHLDSFRTLYERIRPACERRTGVRFEVGFSTQKRSTDTLAVDLENRPLRDSTGRLVLRPGGHGALIENLNEIGGDVVHIQNIDNIVPGRRRDQVLIWRRSLIDELLAVQEAVFEQRHALAGGGSPGAVDAARVFAARVLHVEVPEDVARRGTNGVRDFLAVKLDRPLRVCGMVRNTGEPGGGPFWVRGRDDELSLQIVESAQVDPGSAEQKAIFASATHFNPVHVVCGLRDFEGRPFDLRRFVDPDAVFIARKSKDGRALKALERPGLWNGAMADWNTVFVEIPPVNFTPVKTINDLLRPEHQ
jgi:hypothetical protein